MARAHALVEVRRRWPVGLVRFRDAYGHSGGIPGYTTIAWHIPGRRTIILCQNGIDLNAMLTTENPFVLEAMRG